jgi:hypothetical protein
MMNIFKYFYRNIPVIKELKILQETIQRQNAILSTIESQNHGFGAWKRFVEISSSFQALELLKQGNERYRDPVRLLCHGAQYWSQGNEDGVIEEIFRRIGTCKKTFVEIGVGNGSETNTTALLSQGWSGWWLEADSASCGQVRDRLRKRPEIASRIKVIETFVTPSNIPNLFKENEIPDEVDLFSLDIDLNTFHVWKALEKFRPRVVVVEYNAGISPSVEWVAQLDETGNWDGTQYFGASLKSFEKLADALSYCLVGCDMMGTNAFFVRRDLVKDGLFAAPFTSENHYEPCRYHLFKRMAHASAIF